MRSLLVLVLLQIGAPSAVSLLIQAAVAIVVPALAAYILTAVSKTYAPVAKWADWEKRLLATVYAICMAGLGHALGLHLPDAWGTLSSVDVQAILNAGVAMLLHRIFKGPALPGSVA